MTSSLPWEPSEVVMKEINSDSTLLPHIFNNMSGKYGYIDPNCEESHLHDINPSVTNLKEKMIAKVRVSEISTEDNTKYLIAQRTYISTDRHSQLTAETLSENFMIGPGRAKATLDATIQRGTKSAILPIARRYRADRMFKVPRLHSKFATDTVWMKKKSLRSNIASQLYTHKCGFNAPYHMIKANGENVGNSLNDFVHDYDL